MPLESCPSAVSFRLVVSSTFALSIYYVRLRFDSWALVSGARRGPHRTTLSLCKFNFGPHACKFYQNVIKIFKERNRTRLNGKVTELRARFRRCVRRASPERSVGHRNGRRVPAGARRGMERRWGSIFRREIGTKRKRRSRPIIYSYLDRLWGLSDN